jgi:uncharacterized protein (DUF488 family)
MALSLWTVGHSTRSIEDFLALLRSHGIRTLVDVRRFPASRRYPQFNAEALATKLNAAGIQYRHLDVLGGRRNPRTESLNLGWRTSGFRGYADYMQTEGFQKGLAELMGFAEMAPTAIMCAEAVPWRCHRMLIADALLARGCLVPHILAPDKAEAHRLTSFAKLDSDRLSYPSPTTPDEPASLF